MGGGVGREVVVGWARMIVSAGIGTGVAVQDWRTVGAALFLASMWFVTWSAAEVWIDLRFGVLLGYAPWRHRRWLPLEDFMIDLGDPEPALGQEGQRGAGRHSRTRARGKSEPLLPQLPPEFPRPRRINDDSGPMELVADPVS